MFIVEPLTVFIHYLKLFRIHVRPEAEFMITISSRILGIISDLRCPYTMLTFQNSFNPHFLGAGGGGGLNPLVKVTVNSIEENSCFCPNYAQEFGLFSLLLIHCLGLELILILLKLLLLFFRGVKAWWFCFPLRRMP